VAELAPVGAERVGLDQLCAGIDEAHVQRHDGLGGAQVRLLGSPEPWHGCGQQCSHAAVADDRRPGLEPVEEAVTCLDWGGHLVSFRTRSTHPSGLARPGLAPCPEAGCRRRHRAGSLGLLSMQSGTLPRFHHSVYRPQKTQEGPPPGPSWVSLEGDPPRLPPPHRGLTRYAFSLSRGGGTSSITRSRLTEPLHARSR